MGSVLRVTMAANARDNRFCAGVSLAFCDVVVCGGLWSAVCGECGGAPGCRAGWRTGKLALRERVRVAWSQVRIGKRNG